MQHYDLDSRYATSAPSQGVDGTVTLLARATQSLRAWLYDTKTPPNARPSRLDGGLGRRGRANADTLRAVGPARPPETLTLVDTRRPAAIYSSRAAASRDVEDTRLVLAQGDAAAGPPSATRQPASGSVARRRRVETRYRTAPTAM